MLRTYPNSHCLKEPESDKHSSLFQGHGKKGLWDWYQVVPVVAPWDGHGLLHDRLKGLSQI